MTMTKQELQTLRNLDRRIRHKTELIQQFRDRASSITSALSEPKVQGSGNPEKMAEYAVKAADLARSVEKDIEQLLDLQSKALVVFSFLPPKEQELMELRYLCGYTWEEIAVEMHYSYRNILILHGKILQKIS